MANTDIQARNKKVAKSLISSKNGFSEFYLTSEAGSGYLSTPRINNDMANKDNITESFEVNDLHLVLEPKIHVDQYSSKIGKDDEICVLSFLVNDRQAAIDLVDFFEKGYDFIIDADISASEIKPGSYLVFVELLRRARIIPQIFKIISDLNAASGLNRKDWKFQYVTDENYYPLTKENIKEHVPLSAKIYRETVIEPIDEMKKLSGIGINEHINKDMAIQTLQHAAGINISYTN